MAEEKWFEMAGRLSPVRPVALDGDVLAPARGKGRAGGWLAREIGDDWVAPARALWALEDASAACIGIRVSRPVEDPVGTAAKLIAVASERGVRPIILSELAQSGFERFGFRVERLAGGSDAELAACEEELKRFWGIAVVIEADQIAGLG